MENNVATAKTEHNPKPRKIGFFQKAVRIGAAAVVASTISTSDSKPTMPLNEYTSSPMAEPLDKPDQSVIEFIKEAKSKYGLEVKIELNALYDKNSLGGDPDYLDKYNIGPAPEIIFTTQELGIISKMLDKLSFCSKNIGELTLIKSPPRKNPTAQDEYTRYIRALYTPKPDDQHKDRMLIDITEGIPLDSPIITHQDSGIKTYSELLQQIFFHECGHMVSSSIFRAVVSEKEYYETQILGTRLGYGREDRNPLYVSFAKLEGWEQENVEAFYVKKKSDSRTTYDKAKDKIEEHFAELFGLYFSNPSVLTPQERKFFGKIVDGFKTDLKKFAEQVNKNPMMLLED